jgi:lactate racemase
MTVKLSYGSGTLPVDLPDDRTTVIEPGYAPPVADECAAVIAALENPIATKPLREWIRTGAKVCITFSDITRATPNERIIPWLLDHLAHVPRGDITLINQIGTHRPNTHAELEKMLTPHVVANYQVLNHEPENPRALVQVGTVRDGTPVLINRHVAGADVRIITGFIEPHFFAGFSGGPKGIMPGTAGLQTVMSNHGEKNIGDPQAAFGITEGNPIWEEIRDVALSIGPSFVLNVTLDTRRRITGVFAGDLIRAHKAGCEFVRRTAMQRVDKPFDIVVTTNSGYPLDLNIYQSVKGLSAGVRIVKPGGTLIIATECREGVPAGSQIGRAHV